MNQHIMFLSKIIKVLLLYSLLIVCFDNYLVNAKVISNVRTKRITSDESQASERITISHMKAEMQRKHDKLSSREKWDKTYDYVVVGAGAAGCVVAARLAEDFSQTVLLLEAGGPQNVTSDIPVKAETLRGSDFDWNYPVVPQKNAYLAWNHNSISIPRGRVFGGSTVLNNMNYYRESPEFFKLWDSEFGIKNWSYSDVLPYFLKSENNLDSYLIKKEKDHHKSGGLLPVSTQIPDKILERYLINAKKMGYSYTYSDGRDPFGITLMQKTIKDGLRQSAAVIFLESDFKPNLHTLGFSQVTQILFNKQKRATGVKFYRKGEFHTIKARKEVIISAGVIGSPQLLMLSGIGDRTHLREMKIPVISDLRVGDSMLNSAEIVMSFDIKDQSEIPKPISNAENEHKLFIGHRGPLAYKLSAVHCFREIAYENDPDLSNGCILPRTEFLSNDIEELVKDHKSPDKWREFYKPYIGRSYFGLLAVLRRSKSKGTIRLKSNNPLDYPLIDLCFFCDESDLDNLLKTLKASLKVYQSSYFQKFTELYKNPVPGCDPCLDNFLCDEYLKCVIITDTDYATPIGGCRIGHGSDDTAVVDERLRVRGVSGLRVIDSSILPVVGEQNQAITMMIGERGAHFIKEDSLHQTFS